MSLTASSIMLWFLWAAYWLMPITEGKSIAVTRPGDDSMDRRQDYDWSTGVWGKKASGRISNSIFLSVRAVLQQLGEDKYFSLFRPAGTCLVLSLHLPPARPSLTFLLSLALLPCFPSLVLENKYIQANDCCFFEWFCHFAKKAGLKNEEGQSSYERGLAFPVLINVYSFTQWFSLKYVYLTVSLYACTDPYKLTQATTSLS